MHDAGLVRCVPKNSSRDTRGRSGIDETARGNGRNRKFANAGETGEQGPLEGEAEEAEEEPAWAHVVRLEDWQKSAQGSAEKAQLLPEARVSLEWSDGYNGQSFCMCVRLVVCLRARVPACASVHSCVKAWVICRLDWAANTPGVCHARLASFPLSSLSRGGAPRWASGGQAGRLGRWRGQE